MNIVKVRLRKPTRVYAFLCGDLPLHRDDDCIVKSDRGLEYGTCILPPEPCPTGTEHRYKMNVVRAVTPSDENTYQSILDDEKKARNMCASKIRERRLPMKLVDAEYTFDRHKVVFYFTADQRVDFRELVRDLAHDLKARIELRHIQVRDEAKLVGGLGLCGRELCCATWLREFMPISMKMAKRQNLSLNPSKISGQCGRLLCCLSYENDQYQPSRKSKAVAEERMEEMIEDVGPEPSPLAIGIDEQPELPDKDLREFTAFTELGASVTELEDDDVRRPSSVVEIVAPVEGVITVDDIDGESPEGAAQGQPQEKGEQQTGAPRSRRRRRRRRSGAPREGGPPA